MGGDEKQKRAGKSSEGKTKGRKRRGVDAF